MKKFLVLILLNFFLIRVASANTNFAAVVTNNGKTLSVTLVDDFLPPFEAGLLWASMKGAEQAKWIETDIFSMKCNALPDQMGDMRGSCKIKILKSQMHKIDTKLVLRLEGSEAARLNRSFNDTAYVSMQRGDAWLSSYNPRRQFFFGLEENLIHR